MITPLRPGRRRIRLFRRCSLRSLGSATLSITANIFALLLRFLQHVLQDAMDDQVRIAANSRREVGVSSSCKCEMSGILLGIPRLLQRAEHQETQDALFRL